MSKMNRYPVLTADEAAAMIHDGNIIGFSGFTPAGAVKEIPTALARRAREEHKNERAFKVGVITGASTGDSLDGELARANAVLFRTPYQNNAHLRAAINRGEAHFFDMHLSMLPQAVRYGQLGKLNYAIVEAADITDAGEIILTTSVGATNTFCTVADKIFIELNEFHPNALSGLHDIYEPQDPPNRREIPIYSVKDRIGTASVQVDPKKIAGIVTTNRPDETGLFKVPEV